MGEAAKEAVTPERAQKPKPKKGAICPWLREASVISGQKFTEKQMACRADCAKFGLYYPSGKMEQALGCRRDLR